MKIIERGETTAEKKYQLKCSGCGSILEFCAHECRSIYDQDGNFLTIDCPVCSEKLWPNAGNEI